MNRRRAISLLGGAAVAWPLAARAQQPAMPVVGFLHSGSPNHYSEHVVAFRHGLSEAGFDEGRNVSILFNWAENQYDRLPALAADLVQRKVAVIVPNHPAALPARNATKSIPIVFTVGLDPVAAGLVTSLSRPGGNVTGITSLNVEIAPKLLDLLHEVIPSAKTLASLINPSNPNAETISRDMRAAADRLGLQLQILRANADRDLEDVFAKLTELRVAGLVIAPDSFFNNRSEQIASLAKSRAVPTVAPYREFPLAGGLMSYGGSIVEQYRLAGIYTGRILKGEKPRDLPVQQATKVEMVINLKSAIALGITIPLPLLGRADEVVE